MAPRASFNTDQIKDKARKDLLYLLEAVSKAFQSAWLHAVSELTRRRNQVRGKKNLILERSLAGPIGTIVKVATLQEYGVDKFFFLENQNADTSQRNVIFIARGECARHAQTIAGQRIPRSVTIPYTESHCIKHNISRRNRSRADLHLPNSCPGWQSLQLY